jgi:hypothetical protein
MRHKIEIIDNQIKGYYEYVLYSWKKKRWWNKERWNFEEAHTQGYRWTCPEIHAGKITPQEYFEREVQMVLKNKEVDEIHRIVVKGRPLPLRWPIL